MIQPVIRYRSLKKLEVIILCSGAKLGRICDLEIDLTLGKIQAIFVPGKSSFISCLFKDKKNEIRIPWHEIQRIGDDTILVQIADR